jgi:hypothetical protein
MTVALDDKPEVYEDKVKEERVEKEAPKGASEETPESDLEDDEVVVETTSEEAETQPDVTEEKSTEETETTKDVSDESSEEDTEEKEAE